MLGVAVDDGGGVFEVTVAVGWEGRDVAGEGACVTGAELVQPPMSAATASRTIVGFITNPPRGGAIGSTEALTTYE
jgi:hypothetical protein